MAKKPAKKPIRKHVSSGSTWEEKFAYSRIKRKGALIETAGTIAYKNGKVVHVGDMYNQSKFIFNKLKGALQLEGADMEDVIRTRAYVTDISKAEDVGRAHAEFFKGMDPVMTMVEVSALIMKEALVEIELTAWKE